MLHLTKMYRFYRKRTITGHFSIESIHLCLNAKLKMFRLNRKMTIYGHFFLQNLYICVCIQNKVI